MFLLLRGGQAREQRGDVLGAEQADPAHEDAEQDAEQAVDEPAWGDMILYNTMLC